MRTLKMTGLAVGCVIAVMTAATAASATHCRDLSAWGGGDSKGVAAGQASSALDRRAESWAATHHRHANYRYRSSKNISCNGTPGNWQCTARATACTTRVWK